LTFPFLTVLGSSRQPKAPGRLISHLLVRNVHHPGVSKGQFYEIMTHSGGPVAGFNNVLRTCRKVTQSGNYQHLTRNVKNVPNFQTLGYSPRERPLLTRIPSYSHGYSRVFLPALTTLYCSNHGFGPVLPKRTKGVKLMELRSREYKPHSETGDEQQCRTPRSSPCLRLITGLKLRIMDVRKLAQQ